MDDEIQHLLDLKARMRRGEAHAAEEFQQALEPYLRLMARSALRPGARPTAMTRRIQAEAARVPAADPDALAAEVARRFCERAVARLLPTPVCASSRRDTVVN